MSTAMPSRRSPRAMAPARRRSSSAIRILISYQDDAQIPLRWLSLLEEALNPVVALSPADGAPSPSQGADRRGVRTVLDPVREGMPRRPAPSPRGAMRSAVSRRPPREARTGRCRFARRLTNKNDSHSCKLAAGCSSRSSCPSSSAASSRSLLLAVGGGLARHVDRPARARLLRPRGRHRGLPRARAGRRARLRGRRSAPAATAALVAVAVGAAGAPRAARDRYDSAHRARPRRPRWRSGVILASDVFHSGASVETLLFGSLLLVDGGDIAFAAVSAACVARRRRSCSASAGWRPASTRRSARALGAALGAARRRAARARRARRPSPRSRRSARCWPPRCSSSRPRPRGCCARACAPWQLATRRARRASRASPACGSRSRSTRRPGRRSPCSPAAVFAAVAARPRRSAARRARRGRGRAAAALALLAAGCGDAASAPRAGQARGRRDHDPDRRLRPRGRRRRGRRRTRSCSPTPTRTSTSRGPRDVREHGRRRRRVRERRRPRPLDGRGRRRRRAATRRSSTSARACRSSVAGRERRARGLALRPALVARPAQRRGGRGGDPRRARRRPTRGAARRLRAQRRRLPGAGCARSTRGIARLHRPRSRRRSASSSPTTTPSATSPRRYGITVVGAVIPSQTTQAQPSAGDVARLSRARSGASASRRSSPRARSTRSSRRRSRARPARPRDYTLYGDTLGPGGLRRRHLPGDGAGQRRRDGARLHRRERRDARSRAMTDALVARRGPGRRLRRRARARATSTFALRAGRAHRRARAQRRRQDDAVPRRCSASSRRWPGRLRGAARAAASCRRPSARGWTSRSARSTSR